MSLNGTRAQAALQRIRSGGWSQHKRVLGQVSHDGDMGVFDVTKFDDCEFVPPATGKFGSSYFDSAWFARVDARPDAKFDRRYFDRDTVAFE